MFKEQMYRDLREDLELYERWRRSEKKDIPNPQAKEAILCRFLRQEKEADMGLVIRRHRLALANTEQKEDPEEYYQRADLYRTRVVEYLKRNPKILKTPDEKYSFEVLAGKTGTAIEEIVLLTEKLAQSILLFCEGKGRKNAYVAVREVYLDYQIGQCSLQQVLDRLREVYNRQYVVCEEYKKVLKSKRSVSEGGLRGIRVDMLVEELLTAILVMQAKAVLYDAGFPYEHKERTKDGIVQESAEQIDYKDNGRRRDSALDLVSLYVEAKGNSFYKEGMSAGNRQTAGSFDDDFKLHCMKTFQILQNEKRDKVCLPLYVENKTGSGIYIVGKKLLDAIELKKAERKKSDWKQLYCHFCYLYNLEIKEEGEYSGFSVLISTEYICGDDIDSVIREFQDARMEKYGAFQEQNGAFPEGLDEKYKLFFRKSRQSLGQEHRKEEINSERYKAERERDPYYQKMLKKRKL